MVWKRASNIISDSPVHYDLVESRRRGFHQLAKKQEDQHKHAKVLNLEPFFLLQKMHPNVINNMEHKLHNCHLKTLKEQTNLDMFYVKSRS